MHTLFRVSHGRCVWLLSVFVFTVARLAAQDVTVSPVQWTDPRDAPDELPAVQGTPRFPFPAALRETPDIGYVVISLVLDPKGKHLGMNHAATLEGFELAYQEAPHLLKFSPGRRDGKPVNTSITVALLFNPASAAPGKPDATPRLLEVAVVPLPAPKGAKSTESIPDRVILATVTVDPSGRISAIKDAPPELLEKIETTAKNWRFAPARLAGAPVVADVRVPFILKSTGRSERAEGGRGIPPKVISQVPPIYPLAMRVSGLRGEVQVDFVVDIEGRVRNAFVVRSLNPAFDDPALEAVRKWRFEPARVGDRPVPTHMQVPVMFQLDGVNGGGGDGTRLAKKPDLSKLPEELRYDIAPKLTGTVRPVYPFVLLLTAREGRAVVRYIVDERGRVATATVQEATTPEMGQALLAAIEQFTYQPAVKAGRPSKAVLAFAQEFSRDERHQLASPEDFDLLRREQKKPETIVSLKEIDGKLTPVSQRPPQFPLTATKGATSGEALVEFLVDEDGRTRLPRIVSASEEAFGYAAVQGVSAWRFEPPTRGGRATVVRVAVPIRFRLQGDAPPADTKE